MNLELVDEAPLPPLAPELGGVLLNRLLVALGLAPLAYAWGTYGAVGWTVWMVGGTAPAIALLLEAAADRPPGAVLLRDRRCRGAPARIMAWTALAESALLVCFVGLAHYATLRLEASMGEAPVDWVLVATLLGMAAVMQYFVGMKNLLALAAQAGDLQRVEGLLSAMPVIMSRVPRAEVLLRRGQPQEAVDVLLVAEPQPGVTGYLQASACLVMGDDGLAHLLLARAPAYARRGGRRLERFLAFELQAVICLRDGDADGALAALAALSEPMPLVYSAAVAPLRVAALRARGEVAEAAALLEAGLPPQAVRWYSQVPEIHALLDGTGVERLPVFQGTPSGGAALDATDTHAAPPVRPGRNPSPLGRAASSLAPAHGRHARHAHLLPVEAAGLGPRLPRLLGPWRVLLAMALVLALTPPLVVTLAEPTPPPALAWAGLYLPLLLALAGWAVGRRLPHGPGPLALGDGRRLTAATLPHLRWQLRLMALCLPCTGVCLVALLATGFGPVAVPVVACVAGGAIWLLLGVSFVPLRRVEAAWLVHSAPLDQLPEAVAAHRAPDTEAWWMLAHLLAGRTEQARALDRERSESRREPQPFAWWFRAAEGTLDDDALGPAGPGLGEGARYRRAMAVVLRALQARAPLSAADIQEGAASADALPDRFGGALHRLQWISLREHDAAGADAYAGAHGPALERGRWVDDAWPALTSPAHGAFRTPSS